MKAILFLAALMPLGVLAQPININNNPNQPGYVVPSQQRMQNEMKVQQQQQQSMLKQDLNNQTRSQQQHLQNQLQTNQQRAARAAISIRRSRCCRTTTVECCGRPTRKGQPPQIRLKAGNSAR
jgi:predicted PurR-regulated permease PerM